MTFMCTICPKCKIPYTVRQYDTRFQFLENELCSVVNCFGVPGAVQNDRYLCHIFHTCLFIFLFFLHSACWPWYWYITSNATFPPCVSPPVCVDFTFIPWYNLSVPAWSCYAQRGRWLQGRSKESTHIGRECEKMPVSSQAFQLHFAKDLKGLNTFLRSFIWQTLETRSLDGFFTFKQDSAIRV